jgi:hypothetical protein
METRGSLPCSQESSLYSDQNKLKLVQSLYSENIKNNPDIKSVIYFSTETVVYDR